MANINKDESELSIYDWSYGDIPILDLKRWVDSQIEKGKNKVRLDISWGYYDDIDALEIIAEE